jgi:hypothetical protein
MNSSALGHGVKKFTIKCSAFGYEARVLFGEIPVTVTFMSPALAGRNFKLKIQSKFTGNKTSAHKEPSAQSNFEEQDLLKGPWQARGLPGSSLRP